MYTRNFAPEAPFNDLLHLCAFCFFVSFEKSFCSCYCRCRRKILPVLVLVAVSIVANTLDDDARQFLPNTDPLRVESDYTFVTFWSILQV